MWNVLKSKFWHLQRLIILGPLVGWSLSVALVSAAPAQPSFSDWHLPLPAGEWVISRGPCGSAVGYNHPCGYYEDQCAIDLVAPNKADITNTPVLAPQAGTIAYVGRRNDAGIGVMIEHSDGRVSALFHLGSAVVAEGQSVKQGEVVGYVGKTGTNIAHLHFHVQPNLVERTCLPLDGLDVIDYRQRQVVSRNLPLNQLTLINPPVALSLTASLTQTRALSTTPSAGVILINPAFISPVSYSKLTSAPQLCWSLPTSAGKAPFQFRVRVTGASMVDSGWTIQNNGGKACWQTPPLASGTYYWKVFVRDARGQMNRTNQRPYAFVITK